MIRMYLTDKSRVPGTSGRHEKSDYPTVEAAKAAYAQHPNRHDLEAYIYVDGAAAWFGESTASGTVEWRVWHL